MSVNCLQDFSVHAPTSGITKHYEHEHHTRSHSHSHTRTHADAFPHPYVQASILSYTSSTAQGGGGSFKDRKPIGEVGCCESGMAERSH